MFLIIFSRMLNSVVKNYFHFSFKLFLSSESLFILLVKIHAVLPSVRLQSKPCHIIIIQTLYDLFTMKTNLNMIINLMTVNRKIIFFRISYCYVIIIAYYIISIICG